MLRFSVASGVVERPHQQHVDLSEIYQLVAARPFSLRCQVDLHLSYSQHSRIGDGSSTMVEEALGLLLNTARKAMSPSKQPERPQLRVSSPSLRTRY